MGLPASSPDFWSLLHVAGYGACQGCQYWICPFVPFYGNYEGIANIFFRIHTHVSEDVNHRSPVQRDPELGNWIAAGLVEVTCRSEPPTSKLSSLCARRSLGNVVEKNDQSHPLLSLPAGAPPRTKNTQELSTATAY